MAHSALMNSILLALLLTVQQPPTELAAVIQRATDYVTKYEAELGNLIGTEEYLQTWTSGRTRKMQRRTSSDVLIIEVGKEWEALRKVNRVDGSKVKEEDETFDQAFSDSAADNTKRLVKMKEDSTRYNLGDVVREINLPTFALKVLRESEVWRFSFEKDGTEKIDGVQTWVIHFSERGLQTLVRGDNGELLHSTGTLWIEPATGRVLKTDFDVENIYSKLPIKARTTVSYTRGKTMDILLPHQMSEHYETSASTIDCLADYSNFRRFEVNVKFDFGPPKP
jgi:hypothetical protein